MRIFGQVSNDTSIQKHLHAGPLLSLQRKAQTVSSAGCLPASSVCHLPVVGRLPLPLNGRGTNPSSPRCFARWFYRTRCFFSRKLRLAYDAKQHGWTANSFHSKCDNQGPSILIAKTKGGGYFGAYNPIGVASREDYRECFGAFLVKWPKVNSTKEAPIFLPQTGGGPSIFDFGAEGPIFGTSALKIPLGQAPCMGSSYAQFSGNSLGGGGKEIKEVKSRLGEYQNDENPQRSLFGAKDGKHETALVELRAYVGEGLDGFYG